jgi:uncharacterized DUF497 family protein
MRISRFEWDDGNKEHIARHGVDFSEAEEVLGLDPYIRRGRQERYLAYGPTSDGRYLFVVSKRKRRGTIRVITARDMTRGERRAYRRRME